MNWLDAVIVVILVGAAWLEMSRGFGQALLDALLLYGALWLTNTCTPMLAHSLRLMADSTANHGMAYAVLLIGFGALAFLLAAMLHQQTMIDAGMADRLFGLIAGVAVGMIISHGFMCLVSLNMGGGEAVIAGSFLGNEMLSFTTYHSLITALTGDAPMRRPLPS